MNNIVTIENKEMQIREYNGQRVVTFKDIDTVHERPNGTASRSFRSNKKHFIEGVDYFRRNTSEAKKEYNIIAPNGLILMTESGYLMIVKTFTDDLSWNVQRQLVNAYFRVKSENEIPEKKHSNEKSKYRTSSTLLPKNPNWYQRNRRRMNRICEKENVTLSFLYYQILLRLGEEYDLDRANAIYEEELGYPPKYPMDIVSYFPELADLATTFLDRLEEMIFKK